MGDQGIGQDGEMVFESPISTTRLLNGPEDGPATLLLAHGAGAPMDSPFMEAMATELGSKGWRVVRFEFGYMARMRSTGRRQGPDRMPLLQDAFRQQVQLEKAAWPNRRLVIGGKSMGGRVASLLVDELASTTGICGCLCLGYPFHPPGKPQTLRTEHLTELLTPTLILQGERDPFGKREEVDCYALSPQVTVQWIPCGDHSFKPTKSSGRTEAENWEAAVALADAFLESVKST
jgi:predicted alpha/beta-hydrolase family hydrolase